MPGEIRHVAEFLDMEIADDDVWSAILEHCWCEFMQENSSKLTSILDDSFKGGGKDFVHKGTNGRWRDVLTAEDIPKYENVANENLTVECGHWLASGELPG